jgi:hypothetical protein
MSINIFIVPNVVLEKLRQKARKLKREQNLKHYQALDQVASELGFDHWHHAVDSAKLTSITENAYYNGFVIAMDVKDAQSFNDPQSRFVEDETFRYLVRAEFIAAYKTELESEGVILEDDELQEDVETDMQNYIFFRYQNSDIPKSVDAALRLVTECSFWPPMYLWLNGEYVDAFAASAEDSDGNVVGIRF